MKFDHAFVHVFCQRKALLPMAFGNAAALPWPIYAIDHMPSAECEANWSFIAVMPQFWMKFYQIAVGTYNQENTKKKISHQNCILHILHILMVCKGILMIRMNHQSTRIALALISGSDQGLTHNTSKWRLESWVWCFRQFLNQKKMLGSHVGYWFCWKKES